MEGWRFEMMGEVLQRMCLVRDDFTCVPQLSLTFLVVLLSLARRVEW